MRKMNFNSFQKQNTIPEKEELPEAPKVTYSVYRTVIAHHNSMSDKLKNEPVSQIKTEQ